MGVHPESAHRADDAGRRVSGRIRAHRGRRTAAALALALAPTLGLLCPRAAPAHEGGPETVLHGIERARLSLAAPTGEWGGTALQEAEPATRVVRDNDPGRRAEPKDEGVLRLGDRSVPRPLVETIVRASETTGVDPAYMLALADKESSFDTDVKAATSSAQGLYQFVSGTWLEMIRDYGARHGLSAEAAAVSRPGRADGPTRRRILALRNDPYLAGVMAGEMVNRDRARLEGRIGRTLRPGELYLAHFLGAANAERLLALKDEAPERNADAVFGRAARANRGLFRQNGRSLSVAELHERLDGMIDRRLSLFQGVAGREEDGSEAAGTGPRLDARLLRRDAVPGEVAGEGVVPALP